MGESDNQIASVSATRSKVLDQFDEGDITFRETIEKLDRLHRDEIDLLLQRERLPNANRGIPRNVLLGLFLAAVAGFFASPYIYPKLFGYKSAEQCVLEAKHRWAVDACYDLYSSKVVQPNSAADAQKSQAERDQAKVLAQLNAAEPDRYVAITDPKEIARLSDPALSPERKKQEQAAIDAQFTPVPDVQKVVGNPILTTPAEPLPAAGVVVWYGPSRVGVAPLEIKSSRGGNYLVKLTNATTKQDVLSIFIVGGGIVNTLVPLGTYVVSVRAWHLDRAVDSGLRFPAVWQQFLDATVHVARQSRQHVLEISPRIMPMQLCGL